MLYSEFHARLTARLAEHDLTISDLIRVTDLDALDLKTRNALIPRINATLHDCPDLLGSWFTLLAGEHGALSPAELLHLLTDLVSRQAEESAAMTLAETQANADAAVTRAKSQASVARGKAVTQARKDGRPRCVVCLMNEPDRVPFKCGHLSMCEGRWRGGLMLMFRVCRTARLWSRLLLPGLRGRRAHSVSPCHVDGEATDLREPMKRIILP
jgi:hypothetical protein